MQVTVEEENQESKGTIPVINFSTHLCCSVPVLKPIFGLCLCFGTILLL